MLSNDTFDVTVAQQVVIFVVTGCNTTALRYPSSVLINRLNVRQVYQDEVNLGSNKFDDMHSYVSP
jgi:hypothetical protein